MTTARSDADRASDQLIGSDLGLTPSGLTKTSLVPTTDEPQKAKDFTSDQEVRWCPGCGDYVILNTIRNFLPELGLRCPTESPHEPPSVVGTPHGEFRVGQSILDPVRALPGRNQ